MVDDGIPSRGHRKNLLSNNFLGIGVYTGPHATYETMTDLVFATQF